MKKHQRLDFCRNDIRFNHMILPNYWWSKLDFSVEIGKRTNLGYYQVLESLQAPLAEILKQGRPFDDT